MEKALQEHEIHFSEYDALNGKTATFSLDDVEGFIGKDLEEIAATFYEEKMSLKGQIDFYGDETADMPSITVLFIPTPRTKLSSWMLRSANSWKS